MNFFRAKLVTQSQAQGKVQKSPEVILFIFNLLFNISRMDRYERVEKSTATLGEGTYGVVYKARDKQSNKFVALKVLKRLLLSPSQNYIAPCCLTVENSPGVGG